ncbi:MAG: flagellar hook assembly protein FlgD [Sphingobium sp.]|jgi:flagellar basal-body rod modification protein FlgD|nr:flagellar hook assembly protein FlgD [Sphingomonadaceae bacterium]MCH4152669.1 flagellar hook assembly protein FlgD [Sphingobium sp.]MCI1271514.1 flagellar hook assembly protein FlgD [Sphingobium sp.]MCI1756843.1 flagellar hook assembly protein FlgD [Sphingobium sp.]MCI2052425.1 flagellar hook assembly protein FlgD [Sphingobium sp.]
MATSPITASQPAAAQDNGLAKLSSDYTLFLRLLTTQMQNQDPLSPMDSSQYTQQLVQYSAVEQSIQQTGALKDILARLSAQDMMQASALIGKLADYDGAQAGLGAGAPASWSWSFEGTPASLTAVISDASGHVIERRSLSPDTRALRWDGALSSGGTAAPGGYALALDAKDASGNMLAARIGASGLVGSVSRADDGAVTLMVNGATVPLSAVRNFTASTTAG